MSDDLTRRKAAAWDRCEAAGVFPRYERDGWKLYAGTNWEIRESRSTTALEAAESRYTPPDGAEEKKEAPDET